MIRQKHILLLAAAALLPLAGCLKDPGPSEGGTITIEASIGAQTKVTTVGDGSTFAEGDKIAVYAWTGSASAVPDTRVVDGVVNALGSSGWTAASEMRWKNLTDAHYFLGVSPVHTISDFSAGEYELGTESYAAGDLLVATVLGEGRKASGGAVPLGFKHVMARLSVNIKFGNTLPASNVDGVTVLAKKLAVVDYLAQTASASSSATASELPLFAMSTAASGYAFSYSGPQVPQEGVRQITVRVAGLDYVYTSSTDIPLASGKHTTVNLLVGKDRVELSGVSVSDWGDGGLLSGGAVLPTINGHAWVDLGLPSGLKWATCNVGATKPEEYGDYFAWGETVEKTEAYTWSTLQYCTDDEGKKFSKYVPSNQASYWGGAGSPDNRTVLDAEDDAATANWGAPWRTPTDAEWTELRTKCTWTWTTRNDVKGYLVSNNGNSLFLPVAGYRSGTNLHGAGSHGYYWSSSLLTDYPDDAWGVAFGSGGVSRGDLSRYRGRSVRPVSE